jgi:hypothetical protein
MSLLCKCNTGKEHLHKILARYLEFCHLDKNLAKASKFLYNYERRTVTVQLNNSKALEFDIGDFIEWDSVRYKDDMCYDAAYLDSIHV